MAVINVYISPHSPVVTLKFHTVNVMHAFDLSLNSNKAKEKKKGVKNIELSSPGCVQCVEIMVK